MMHGMTGDASMMRPFAEKVLPEGWTLIVPEARYMHPRRGRTWWRYENEDADAMRRMNLSRRELIDVDSSLSQLEQLIADQAPMGPLVVGGFSPTLLKERAHLGLRLLRVIHLTLLLSTMWFHLVRLQR